MGRKCSREILVVAPGPAPVTSPIIPLVVAMMPRGPVRIVALFLPLLLALLLAAVVCLVSLTPVVSRRAVSVRLVVIVPTVRACAPIFVVPLAVAVVPVAFAFAFTITVAVPVILRGLLTSPARRRAAVFRRLALALLAQALLLRICA